MTAYAASVMLAKVSVTAPAIPLVVEDVKGVVRFQHSKAELLALSVTMAVRVRKVWVWARVTETCKLRMRK